MAAVTNLDELTLGSKVQVKVTTRPTNQNAAKTLKRLMIKDPEQAYVQRKLTKIRHDHYNPQMRGGRLYGGQMPRIQRVKGELGDQVTLKATYDVVQDLKSCQRFIEVTPVA